MQEMVASSKESDGKINQPKFPLTRECLGIIAKFLYQILPLIKLIHILKTLDLKSLCVHEIKPLFVSKYLCLSNT